MYKFCLDKSSKKFTCPQCQKKTFVRFINNESGEYENLIYGRCDRESKCTYFNIPECNKLIYSKQSNNKPKPSKKPTYHNIELTNPLYAVKYQNNFLSYLLINFNAIDVWKTIEKYRVGSCTKWKGSTIFWQIDQEFKVRGGKVMLYNKFSGKRVKKPYNHITWVHKHLKIDKFNLNQCLFGLHLIANQSKNKTICVVESEKTALIMSIVLPEYQWLATGSKSGFKESYLYPIKDFKVIAYPDKSVYTEWKKVADSLNAKGYKIRCSDFAEEIDIDDGDDLVDYLLPNKVAKFEV